MFVSDDNSCRGSFTDLKYQLNVVWNYWDPDYKPTVIADKAIVSVCVKDKTNTKIKITKIFAAYGNIFNGLKYSD